MKKIIYVQIAVLVALIGMVIRTGLDVFNGVALILTSISLGLNVFNKED